MDHEQCKDGVQSAGRSEAIKSAASGVSDETGLPLTGTDMAAGPDETVIGVVFRCEQRLTPEQRSIVENHIRERLRMYDLDKYPVFVVDGGCDLRVEKVKKDA